jgi:hypothetical protein
MSYNTSDINKLKQQIKQYYSFIKNDGIILTNFAKYLLSKADMNLENAVINLKEMSIKDIQNKLYDLTLELNTGNEISDIIKNKIDEENKNLKDVYSKVVEYVDLHKKYKIAIDSQINKNKKLVEEYELLKDTENKKLEDYKEKFQLLKDINEKELITIKDTIDGIYRNQIYDNEYTFEESKYIKKEPVIHLDVDKILEDLKNGCCYIKINDNIKNNIIVKFTNQEIKFNFPLYIKLHHNEYIIKFYVVYSDGKKMDNSYSNLYNDVSVSFFVMYITNYGRIIKTNNISYRIKHGNYNMSPGGGCASYQDLYTIYYDRFNVVVGNTCCDCYVDFGGTHYVQTHWVNLMCKKKIELIEQPKLNYRIPRLFIDVIDAFHTQNTDLMQECCKKYLDITRESKIKDSILKDLELNNKLKEKDDIIKSKDIELEDKNKIIISQQQEINKLKEELMKFKKSLSNLIGE